MNYSIRHLPKCSVSLWRLRARGQMDLAGQGSARLPVKSAILWTATRIMEG